MPIAEQRRTTPILIFLLVAAVVAGVFFAVRSLTHETVEVRVTRATYQSLLSTVSTNGKVEPVEEFQAHAPYPGTIEDIYVDVGQKVKKGTLLIRMNDADLVARVTGAKSVVQSAETGRQDILANGSLDERIHQEADLKNAQLELQDAQRDLAVKEKLQQQGAASAAEVTAARQRVQTAQITLQTAQQRATKRFTEDDIAKVNAQVADAKAGLAASETALAGADIRSPIEGTVYSIPVSQYDYVPGGDDLLDVADLNRVQIRAYFDEPEIGKLAKGQTVKIVWDAKPNVAWHGHIERAPSTVITYGTRNVGECLIAVDDARGDLLPNTNVTVTVTTSERSNVLSIPREALHTDGVNNFVFRVVGNALERTPVQVGVVNLTRVEVTGGLSDKDVVALNATSNRELKNGLEVKPVE